MPALSPDFIRKRLLAIWGDQACLRPEHWPDVLERLLKPATASSLASPNNHGRQSLKPAVDEAVAALLIAFADGQPADPAAAARRAFPRLDRSHCAALAAQLADPTP